MSPKIFLCYLATWLLVALTPGPAVLFSMAQSTRRGWRSSLLGICGVQCGSLVFCAGVAVGLGMVLARVSLAFTILRAVGAIYLSYLGVQIISSTLRRRSSDIGEAAAVPRTRRSLFLQGLLLQITNPKALLFVTALLPQFIDPHRAALPQFLILGWATVVVDAIVLSAYAWLAERGVQSFRTTRLAAWVERVYGAALVFFGLRLMLSRR